MRAERDGHGDDAGRRRSCARPTSCPRPSGSPSCCGRCRPSSSTWRSSSTSTAAPPGWSPSRTSSRSWSARSSTSTTSRTPQVEPLPDGDVRVDAPHADRRGQRAARRSSCPRATGTRSAGSLFNQLGHVPAEGEARRGRRATGCGPSGCRAAASSGVRHRAAASRRRRARAATRTDEVGLRHARRPAQRREVDAAQPDPRHEGDDRLRQAADDPHPGAGRAQPARRAGRVRRHARHPQAPHAAGRAAQRHRRATPSATSTSSCLVRRRHRAGRAGRPVRRRAGAAATRSSWSTRSTSRRPTRCSSSWPRPPSSTSPSTSRCRPAPATASTRSSRPLVARLPEGPRYYPDDMVTDVPEAFWVAELVREQLLAVDPRRAAALDRHPGDRVGVAPHPRARSSSSATRRRAS